MPEMQTEGKEPRVKRSLLSRPVNRLLILSFLLIALIPVSILGMRVYQAAWDGAWREINEKHRLLAMNLASPLGLYVKDHRAMLGLLAKMIGNGAVKTPHTDREILQTAIKQLGDFHSLALVDTHGHTRVLVGDDLPAKPNPQLFAREQCYLKIRDTGRWSLSGIKTSPLNGKPTLIMGQPVVDTAGKLKGVLLGELRVSLIEELRRKIHFGKKGHSAIVDQFGHVIAHPNPVWMREMKDISSWPIVKKMLAGKTGVTEFYSPFIKSEMVAGYAAVPEIGWGIMVPQPKSEVETQVRSILRSHLRWGLIGLALAGLLGILLARWITQPINRLADAAHELARRQFRGRMPTMSRHAPEEIQQLGTAVHELVSGLQQSRTEVEDLNRSLQSRIEEATAQLREANSKLEALSRKDHLTALANRRHFETTLAQTLDRRRSDNKPLCVMLIDIDNFKEINDRFGHAAGDTVLVQLAALLERNMRQGDLVARYGGDEFAAQMRCDMPTGHQRARELLETIRAANFTYREQNIHVTVSIGLLYREHQETVDVETLLRKVDTAMYEAKDQGRDTVVEITI
jgi:diguanylate cyclase (GGDEF)-like protein